MMSSVVSCVWACVSTSGRARDCPSQYCRGEPFISCSYAEEKNNTPLSFCLYCIALMFCFAVFLFIWNAMAVAIFFYMREGTGEAFFFSHLRLFFFLSPLLVLSRSLFFSDVCPFCVCAPNPPPLLPGSCRSFCVAP